MKTQQIEDKFLDYLEGTLTSDEQQTISKALSEDPSLKESFENYKKVLELEHSLAHSASVEFNITEDVMRELSSSTSFFERIRDYIARQNNYFWYSTAATCAIILIAISLKPDSIKPPGSQAFTQKAPVDEVEPSEAVMMDQQLLAGSSIEAEEMTADLLEPKAPAPIQHRNEALEAKAFSKAAPAKKEKELIERDNSRARDTSSVTIGDQKYTFLEGELVSMGSSAQNSENPALKREQRSSDYIDEISGLIKQKSKINTTQLLSTLNFRYPTLGNDPIQTHYEISPSPLEPNQYLLLIGVQGRQEKGIRILGGSLKLKIRFDRTKVSEAKLLNNNLETVDGQVLLGDIYTNKSKTLIYSLKLASTDEGLTTNTESDKLASFSLRYLDPENFDIQTETDLIFGFEADDFRYQLSSNYRFAAAAMYFGIYLNNGREKTNLDIDKIIETALLGKDFDPSSNRMRLIDIMRKVASKDL